MRPAARTWVLGTGVAAAAGAVLHVAILFGGPEWYAFFGAPRGLVEMARAGHPRAPISCLVIAAFLSVLAAYAFSAAGAIRRLPLLRLVCAGVAAVLLLRGALFVPLTLWRSDLLARICDCREVNTFIVVTSLLCLAMGVGFALGALDPAPARKADGDRGGGA